MPADTAYIVKIWEKMLIMLDRSSHIDLVLLCCLEIMSVLVMSSRCLNNLTSFLHCSVLLVLYIYLLILYQDPSG